MSPHPHPRRDRWDLVVFDNDGVLVDSERLANEVLAGLLTEYGYPVTWEESAHRFMGGSIVGIRRLVEADAGRALPADFEERYHQGVFAEFRSGRLQRVPGVAAVLDELARRGMPFCVASSGTHERIRLALSTVGLLDRFPEDRVFSAEDVAHGKPAPDLFLLVASRLGVDADRCVVIEDSPTGVTAARAAGMTVVGYAAMTPASRLLDAGAAAVVTAMDELVSVLDREPLPYLAGVSESADAEPADVESVDPGALEEVRRWLRSQGATEEQVTVVPDDPEELQRLAVDLVLNRDAVLSIRQVAERRDIDPERVVEVLRAYGVVVPDIDAVLFTEADAELFAVSEEASMFDAADTQALTRAVATALDRVADAAVALYVQGAEADLLRAAPSPLAWAQKSAYVTELAGQLGVGMGILFRHHLRQAIGRQRVSQVGVASPDVARIAIGFVDLVGSTALGETLEAADLRKLVSEFEARAFDVASRSGGRVVKFIGDEIMVAALDPLAGCRLMLALVEECSLTGMQPRGGMSWGEVLFRGGDYYGREVNLASRLVDAAIPGEVLVDASVVRAQPGGAAASADADLTFERAGRRLLKGFADPVEVWSVTAGHASV